LALSGGRTLRHAWWVVLVAVLWSCDSAGPGKVGTGSGRGGNPDGGIALDGGTFGLDGGNGSPDAGPGSADAGAPDGGPGGGSGFTTIRWQQLAPRPLGTSEAHGALVGGKLYTFGGFNWSTPCCTPWRYAYVYDPVTNAWTRLADMPEGLTHAGATTDGTDIFYAGGFPEDASRTFQIFGTKHVWRYRVATDSYEAMPDLPDFRGAGALQYLEGRLHFFGGESFGQGHDTPEHWVLDLAGGGTTWVPAAPMLPGRARNHLGSAVYQGKIYAVGGQHGHDEGLVETPLVDVYDPVTDSWSPLADMPLAKGHIAMATFVFQGRILVIAGEISNGVYTAETAAYDPAGNSWVELTPFPSKRHSGIARPMLGGFVYTTGEYSQESWLGLPGE
jgi:N-acetylneuraminic acid mutarotase